MLNRPPNVGLCVVGISRLAEAGDGAQDAMRQTAFEKIKEAPDFAGSHRNYSPLVGRMPVHFSITTTTLAQLARRHQSQLLHPRP